MSLNFHLRSLFLDTFFLTQQSRETQLPPQKRRFLCSADLSFSDQTRSKTTTMVASDEIREVALTLAQDNLDDDAAEESVSHAMWLIKEAAAREELSGPLGLEVGEF